MKDFHVICEKIFVVTINEYKFLRYTEKKPVSQERQSNFRILQTEKNISFSLSALLSSRNIIKWEMASEGLI